MIELTHTWSELDQQHQFGIVLTGEETTSFNWVWFHLGRLTKEKPMNIYPYGIGVLVANFNLMEGQKTAGQLYASMVNVIDMHTPTN
jgi:hypothetical protein